MAEREWFEKDYYKVLGLDVERDRQGDHARVSQAGQAVHPDSNPGSEEKFKEVSVAYDVLGDDVKRKEYDEVRRLGPAAGGFGRRPGAGAGGFNFQTGDFGDLGDLFGGLFGGGRRQPGPARRRPRDRAAPELSRRGEGVTTTVSLPEQRGLSHLQGHAARAPGSGFVTCERCHGRGVAERRPGSLRDVERVPGLPGSRRTHRQACPTCHGTGREPSSRRVNVRVPAGVVDGQRIRLKGKGNPGTHGGPAGDLFVDVHVAPDARFDRRGRHVTTTVEVPLTQAILGTTVEVATLDEPVTLKIPAGTQPGTTCACEGRGVPARRQARPPATCSSRSRSRCRRS